MKPLVARPGRRGRGAETTAAAGVVVAAAALARGVDGVFIEDAARVVEEPTVHFVVGINEQGKGFGSNVAKSVWANDLVFDFQAAASVMAPAAALAAGAVRIYVHDVVPCAGEELLRSFGGSGGEADESSIADGDVFGWALAVRLHARHIGAMHRAILSSRLLTTDPGSATAFYIPAFPSLLVERFIDTKEGKYVNCLADMWHSLPEHILLRNAGYDHFIVEGTCHPWSVCGAMECDGFSAYHPFAGNVAVLTGGVRELGSLDSAFDPARMYRALRIILIPFPVTLDCDRLRSLATAPGSFRSVAVAFMGTENSRVRHYFRLAMEDARWNFASDPRVVLRVFPDHGDGEFARRAAFGADGGSSGNGSSGVELYGRSEFCLILPGHIYDLGRRGFDAIARGCLPVIVSAPPMHVSLPFAWQVPWRDFTLFSEADSAEDAASIVADLLAATETAEGRAAIAVRRAALVRHATSIFLPPLVNCPGGARTAVDGVAAELAVRQAAWATLRAERGLGAVTDGNGSSPPLGKRGRVRVAVD